MNGLLPAVLVSAPAGLLALKSKQDIKKAAADARRKNESAVKASAFKALKVVIFGGASAVLVGGLLSQAPRLFGSESKGLYTGLLTGSLAGVGGGLITLVTDGKRERAKHQIMAASGQDATSREVVVKMIKDNWLSVIGGVGVAAVSGVAIGVIARHFGSLSAGLQQGIISGTAIVFPGTLLSLAFDKLVKDSSSRSSLTAQRAAISIKTYAKSVPGRVEPSEGAPYAARVGTLAPQEPSLIGCLPHFSGDCLKRSAADTRRS